MISNKISEIISKIVLGIAINSKRYEWHYESSAINI